MIANIVAMHIGLRVMGLALGLLFGSLGAGILLGGWIFDLTARYDGLWWIATALAALAGVSALLALASRAAAAA